MANPITEAQWLALAISNDFMFSKVMEDKSLCKEVVELLLEKKIGEIIDYQREKNLNITHDSKTVRLDVYLKDEEKVINVEMQVRNIDNLKKRARYYQAAIDLDFLGAGKHYNSLPDSYVIFICTFDYLETGKARNSFQYRNDESGAPLEDGTHRIFFNSKGKDLEKDSLLQQFLAFVSGDLEKHNSDHPLLSRLKDRLIYVKQNDELKVEYMKFELDARIREEEILAKGRAEEKFSIARNLLDIFDNTTIASRTGLTELQVEELRAIPV